MYKSAYGKSLGVGKRGAGWALEENVKQWCKKIIKKLRKIVDKLLGTKKGWMLKRKGQDKKKK